MVNKSTNKQIKEIITKYKKGISGPKLSREYGISCTAVYGLLKRRNSYIRNPSEAGKGKISHRKGISLVEEYGEEQAKQIRQKMSRSKMRQHPSPQTEFKKDHIPWNKNKYLVDLNLEMTQDLAYILGFAYGDGWAVKGKKGNWVIGFCNTQRRVIQYIQNTLIRIGFKSSKIYERQPSICDILGRRCHQKRFYILKVHSKKLYDLYFTYLNNTNKFIQDITPNLQYIYSFLRGMYEAEGGVYQYRKKSIQLYAIHNTDKRLIDLVSFLLNYLSIPSVTYIRKRKRHRDIYSTRIRGNKKFKINFLNTLNPIIKRL